MSRYKAKKRLMEAAIDSSYQALGVPYLGVDRDSTSYPPSQLRMDNTSMKEDLIYFYHKDHLGSSNTILDSVGNILQRIEYLPYGEVMVDEQQSADYATPYKFNGKELDEETGLLYYGARFFDPKRVLWYSTDPMEVKYPNVTSYGYTMGNPVNAIDYEGQLIIFINGQHGGSGGSRAYWNGLDARIMNWVGDLNPCMSMVPWEGGRTLCWMDTIIIYSRVTDMLRATPKDVQALVTFSRLCQGMNP